MGRERFSPKVVIVCSKEEKGFDCKNNHRCGKLANFRLDDISKMNCKTLVVLSYTSSGLGTREIQLVWKVFK